LLLARAGPYEPAELEPVRIGHEVFAIVDSLRRESANVPVSLSIPDRTPLVDVNRGYFQQVIRNLLGNSLKYAGTPIAVTVDAEPDGGATVTIADEGPGVPPDELERIFTRFYRSPGTSQRVAGTGIGLTLCARLVALMGGRIWAENRAAGGLS